MTLFVIDSLGLEGIISLGSLPTDVLTNDELQTEFSLKQNYPNPFNPETTIRFQLPEASHVVLKIFNLVGQEVKAVVDEQYQAGEHSVQWDGKDDKGNVVSSGMYFYQIKANDFRDPVLDEPEWQALRDRIGALN